MNAPSEPHGPCCKHLNIGSKKMVGHDLGSQPYVPEIVIRGLSDNIKCLPAKAPQLFRGGRVSIGGAQQPDTPEGAI